ncbi:MAG: YggS family pyridoxal phosphate-dependent enzyme [Candidatus Omnitrophota bacterium]
MIKQNIVSLFGKIENACGKSSYVTKDQIRVVCVVKYAQVPQIREAVNSGLLELGENRLQDALKKAELLDNRHIKWHMVGNLQSNKVKKAVEFFELIHSVDSLKLALLINEQASKINKVQEILLQVNTQGKKDAFGLLEEEITYIIKDLKQLEFVKVRGFMTIAPLSKDVEETRPFFRKLRELRDEMERENKGLKLPLLSMGMSQDFEIAIEEGANMLRIGRLIFEEK